MPTRRNDYGINTEFERDTLRIGEIILGDGSRQLVTAVTGPGGGSRLFAGNLPADMAQLSNVVVSDGALQSWTANGIDYVATYAGGKVATVTTSDGWVQTYTWAGDVPTITVAEV